MPRTLIIIPARYDSKRFPGKPLQLICGKELIIHVADKCVKAVGKQNLYVATDSIKIKKKVLEENYKVIMTSKRCLTGTDRVAEASKKIKSDIYINVQGDEPLVSSNDIKKIIQAKKKNPNFVICGYSNITKRDDPKNKNIPKVVINKFKELVYISRAVIPSSKGKNVSFNLYKQVCIYAFNAKELERFSKIKKKSEIENIEDIEILRLFDLGIKIKMIKLKSHTVAVDEKKDIKKVEKILKK